EEANSASTINAQNEEITRLALINTRYKKEVQKLNEKIQKQATQEKKMASTMNQEITRLDLINTQYKKEIQ
ncbi:7578_t:CDS:1, partial [Ambispora leptoticha]